MEFTTIAILLRFLAPYRWVLPVMAMFGLAASFAEGIGIGLLIPLLDVLLHTARQSAATGSVLLEPVRAYLAHYTAGDQLVIIGVGIMALLSIKAGLVFASSSLSAWINGRVNNDIRCALFTQTLSVDYAFLVQNAQGRLINAFESQAWRTMDAINALFDGVTSICTVLVFVALLLLISWPLTLGVIALAGAASLIVGRPLVRRINNLSQDAVSASAEVSQRVLNSLLGMRVIRAFGREDHERKRFEAISETTTRLFFRMDRTVRTIPALLELAYAPIFLATILIAPTFAVGIPTLLAFLFLFYRLQPQIKALDQHRAQLASFSGSFVEFAALLDTKDKPASRTGTIAFGGLIRAITLRHVGFRYAADGDSRRALEDISADIGAKQVTAIVGASGAGKTTLINLLYRFFEPSEGAIFVDDVPLADLDVASWRAKLALAGQDAALLDGSILDNIAAGCPEADMERIKEVARSAALHEFIETLPRGYFTQVGDRGLRLSEGQRQRIGLARALLRRPDILILDEATNALDGLTEQTVHRALEKAAKDATVIVIAHRLSTVRKADRILVLEDGKLVEHGTAAELLSQVGTFTRLQTAQLELKDMPETAR